MFLSVMLVVALLIPGTSAFAATKTEDETTNEEQASSIKSNITTLENDIKSNNTDVISELNEQISDFQSKLNSASDSKEKTKIKKLITTTESLISDYSNYKESQSNKIAIQRSKSSSNSEYSAAVATVIAYFDSHNYRLAAELLTHARDNDQVDSLYGPEYGYICAESPVVANIWNSSKFDGSSVFPYNYWDKSDLKDLYYAIHEFKYYKYINPSSLLIRDRYDYTNKKEYHGVAGVAINTMYKAQAAGIIVPYQVVITLNRN